MSTCFDRITYLKFFLALVIEVVPVLLLFLLGNVDLLRLGIVPLLVVAAIAYTADIRVEITPSGKGTYLAALVAAAAAAVAVAADNLGCHRRFRIALADAPTELE